MGNSSTKSAQLAVSIVKLSKLYEINGTAIEVLRDLDLSVSSGEFITICGTSGSGKTTLLNLIGGIDKPTSGKISLFGEDLTGKDEDALADLRCRKIGYVFQSYNLVSTLTVAENIAFPMEWVRAPIKQIEERVTELLALIGMNHRENHFPDQLSGGEQQRVAFARALANDPPLILADEPSGNLDAVNSQKITDVLCKLRSEGKTVIVSTHEKQLLGIADQRLCLMDGRLGVYGD